MIGVTSLPVLDAGAVDRVLAHHGGEPTQLVQILRAAQEFEGWLPPSTITYIASRLGLPRAQVEGVAGYYAFLHLAPVGRYHVLFSDNVTDHITMCLFSDADARQAGTALGLKGLFEIKKVGVGGTVIQRYRDKTKKAKESIKSAKAVLQKHRNLDEDYCRVKVVNIEEVSVCADVELKPDADIEWVQARIWFEIERYFNPPVPFYTLQELMDAGEPVEEIFNGPELNSGFIKSADLEAASLKSELRVSDIINLLMDIDGVIAVNQLQLTKYDAEGNIVRGAADPDWNKNGKLDANKISASWLLRISDQHQPRLYLNGSRFLFYKNGAADGRADAPAGNGTQGRGHPRHKCQSQQGRSRSRGRPDRSRATGCESAACRGVAGLNGRCRCRRPYGRFVNPRYGEQ